MAFRISAAVTSFRTDAMRTISSSINSCFSRGGKSLSVSPTSLSNSLGTVTHLRIPANVTGHSGHRDRFAHGHHAGVGFVL